MTARRDPQISIAGENGHRELEATLDGPSTADVQVTVGHVAIIIGVLAAVTIALVIIGLLSHEIWRAMLIGWRLG